MQRLASRRNLHVLILLGAVFADEWVTLCRLYQHSKITRGRDVFGREASGVDVVRVGHAKRFRLGVHGRNGRFQATRIEATERAGGAIFRRHQGELQHFAARQLAADRQPRATGFQIIEILDVNGQQLIKILLGIKHDHCGHEFGDAGNRGDRVGVFRINRLAGAGIDDQRGLRKQVRTLGVDVRHPERQDAREKKSNKNNATGQFLHIALEFYAVTGCNAPKLCIDSKIQAPRVAPAPGAVFQWRFSARNLCG